MRRVCRRELRAASVAQRDVAALHDARRDLQKLIESIPSVWSPIAPGEWIDILRRHAIEHVGPGAKHGASRQAQPDSRLGVVAGEGAEELLPRVPDPLRR